MHAPMVAGDRPRQPSDHVLALADERYQKLQRLRALKRARRELDREIAELKASIPPDPLEREGRVWP